MTINVIRAELRKLATTKMPLAFLAILIVFAAVNAFAVIAGTDMDGSKAFISTAADQQSLVAFAANGFMLAAMFGAIAVSREYAHHTVIPTFLASPQRSRAVVAQLVAVALAGMVLSVVGMGLTAIAVALALPTTDFGFLIAGATVVRLVAAAAFAGATGAVLGAGLGAIIRSVGGAVAATTVGLVIVPPLVVQLASETGSWMPSVLANVLAGVGTDVSGTAAIAALGMWALIPAMIGLVAVQRRDVV